MLAKTDRTSAKLFLIVVATLFLLAYVERWLYLSHYLTKNVPIYDINPDWNRLVPQAFDQAFLISMLIFGVFFLISGRFQIVKRPDVARVGFAAPNVRQGVLLVAVIAVTIAIRKAYGVVMGEAPAEIPLGMGPVIYRAQSELFPGLLILFAEASWSAGRRKEYWGWVAALAAFNLAMSLVTTSKAGLIFFGVEYLMLMYLTGQNIATKPLRLALIVIAALATFVIAAQLRSQQLLGTDAEILIAFREGRVLDTFLEVIGLIANRLPGTEGLALYCGYSCEGLPFFSFPALNGEASLIYTQDIVRVASENDFRSPGFIGGAIIVSGFAGGAFLSIAFLRLCLYGFRSADTWGVSAAAKITACFGVFRFMLEGTWDWKKVASFIVAAILVEAFARTQLTMRGEARVYA